MADRPTCPYQGCDYPVGECSGDCLTPRAGFDSAPALPIDFAHPDPAPAGDPWPLHLCMPSVEWPEPVGPVLRPDSAPPPAVCPPCTGNCHQGRDCPARASCPVSPWEVVSAVLPWLVFSALAVYSVARHYAP